MIGKTNDLPRALPLIAPPGADELLSEVAHAPARRASSESAKRARRPRR
jgi:hypothetical protein